jgi:flagellar capping protein FliD
LSSHSNTITESSSGLAGLSVTALREGGTAQVTVTGDVQKMKEAIAGFVEQYNKVQSLIDTQTLVQTDSSGQVTSATLAGESEVSEIARSLRGAVFGQVAGLSSVLDHLQDLGYDTNSEDNTLTLKDETVLTEALTKSPAQVGAIFSDESSGLALKLDAYLDRLVGINGSLIAKQDALTRQASDIDVQVADLERIVQSNRQRLIQSFIAMEQAQAQANQQLQFLSQRFSAGSTG